MNQGKGNPWEGIHPGKTGKRKRSMSSEKERQLQDNEDMKLQLIIDAQKPMSDIPGFFGPCTVSSTAAL